MSIDTGFIATFRRELSRMGSRKMYLGAMICIPVLMALFFVSLLSPGLPLRTPTAVVDLDHSAMSRTVIRSLNAEEVIAIDHTAESFHQAMEQMQSGKTFGFFVIPRNFENDVMAGRKPTLEYYSNMTYFVPGTLAFKGFKTVAVGTSAGVVKTTLQSMGVPGDEIAPMVQPVATDMHPIGNPWTNYGYYLAPSFTFGTLALIIMLMTAYTITTEIKMGTSTSWLSTAHNRISVALAGKLAPHTIVYWVIGLGIVSLFLGWAHYPCRGSVGVIIAAMLLMVPACQALSTFIVCLLPNPRLSLSVIALISILAFSIAGFSFPVPSMYGAIAIFSYILPVRYMFLIYVNETLGGWGIYYLRYYFVALIAFLPLFGLMAWKLKRACLNPVYIP